MAPGPRCRRAADGRRALFESLQGVESVGMIGLLECSASRFVKRASSVFQLHYCSDVLYDCFWLVESYRDTPEVITGLIGQGDFMRDLATILGGISAYWTLRCWYAASKHPGVPRLISRQEVEGKGYLIV